MVLAFIAIMFYVWVRFEWHFGLGVLVALIHDVILSLGFMSITNYDFNLSTIAAILTIIGYSVNDSVVIYDRIRESLRDTDLTPLGGEGMTIEADETYVGGKEKNKHRSKRRADHIGGVGKEMVFSLVERKGRVRSHHLANISAKNLRPLLDAQLADASATKLMTDGEGQYRIIGPMFKSHEVVNHGIGEYVRGDAHTNTIEGYFSILKRGIIGTYHHVSAEHLKRYLAEFDFRYNNREGLGVGDRERMVKSIAGIVGKRLTYRRTSREGAAVRA